MQDETWLSIKQRLSSQDARVMVNLGQSPVGVGGRQMHPDAATTIAALSSMHRVFDSQVSVLHIRNMDNSETQNTVAITGPYEGLQELWKSNVPQGLKHLTEEYCWERHQEV